MNNTSSFVGFVPNNADGWGYIKLARHFLKGTTVRLKAFGRNKNRKQYAKNPSMVRQYRCNLPLKHATHYGLYLYGKKAPCKQVEIDLAKNMIQNILSPLPKVS